ncbi:MAG: response regulator transcription factor [Oscillospiraceae bacterium]|nr:response regulator transcription factor [Oscillospiraceae bacterium]
MTEPYQILVVDDDPSIVNIIETALRQAGYQVLTACDGETACRLAASHHPHLIIMDVMMPQCNGLVATMRIRQSNNVPILMLSAKAEGSDRVLGLEAGADDYLVKPFYQQELLARVRALLRRYDALGSIRETKPEQQLRVGDVVLDTAKKQLFVRGEALRLTATEYKILQILMSNPGRVFSAEEIYSRAWESDAYAVENTVMVHISRIREKLELNPKKPEYLKVVWGIGYVFDAP